MLRFNSNLLSFLRKAGKCFLHVWFPRVCFACQTDLPYDESQPLCAACRQQLTLPGPLICQRCGVELKSGGAHCFSCRGSKGEQFKCKCIRSAFVFNNSSRALVHALKYQGADYVASFMGQEMARCYARLPELSSAQVVVPVPLYPKRRRKRGYNQSELLARAFAAQTGLVLDTQCLIRTRDTCSQTQLGRRERLENMNGAFVCVTPQTINKKIVLLIDDVATTGATLEGCARALRQAGAKRVLAYTFAREN